MKPELCDLAPQLGAVPSTPAISASPVTRYPRAGRSAPVALRGSQTGGDPPLATLQRLAIGLRPATPFRTSRARRQRLPEPCQGAGEHGGIVLSGLTGLTAQKVSSPCSKLDA